MNAPIYNILYLSGITPNFRASRNAIRSGSVYLDGALVPSLQTSVKIGDTFLLEVRYNGKTKGKVIFLSKAYYLKPKGNAVGIGTFVEHRRG